MAQFVPNRRRYANPDNPFGMTCPVLMVARKHNVEYGVALTFAHVYAFGEMCPGGGELANQVDETTAQAVADDVALVYA